MGIHSLYLVVISSQFNRHPPLGEEEGSLLLSVPAPPSLPLTSFFSSTPDDEGWMECHTPPLLPEDGSVSSDRI